MPPPSSHTGALRPSPLLAVVAASIVRAFDPSWLSRPVGALAGEVGIRTERVSRLWRRLLAPFETLLARASTRGRRRREPASTAPGHRAVRDALLAVAAEVIRATGVRKRRLQDLLVATAQRLEAQWKLSRRAFCQSLGISERNLRYWAARKARPAVSPTTPRPVKPRKPRNEGRFDLHVTLPGIQAMADTTDFSLFDVPLKIVAVQDPGARHERLWEAFAVEEQESSDVVVGVLTEALAEHPGIQLVTDRGSPYLAQATRTALEALEAEHAPAREAAPTGKATLERSFGTVKAALAAVAALTGRIAAALPALRSPELAKAFAKVLLATFLRVYTAAARAAPADRPADPVILAALAEVQREKARDKMASARTLLASLFERYQFPGSRIRFVRAHAHHHPDDIRDAERRMGHRACRCHAKTCDRYYASILENVARENQPRRVRERRDAVRRAQAAAQAAAAKAREQHRLDHPEDAVVEGLDLIAAMHQPEKARLFADGRGPGTRALRQAIQAIARQSPTALHDRTEVAWRIWVDRVPVLDTPLASLVREVFEQVRAEATPEETPSPGNTLRATLLSGSRQNLKPRPSPTPDLRIWPARSGAT